MTKHFLRGRFSGGNSSGKRFKDGGWQAINKDRFTRFLRRRDGIIMLEGLTTNNARFVVHIMEFQNE